ncbi:hypothetical protein EOPP23_20860 [Endozoicomonas sp. OPT23]|uniref:FixH family protein n=1 Tax=Endozoicomonas sp. OPT23 TaxID=2072845 RepID=UPI00129B4EA4|nr:FixH family protein [Endozoicomonas sp. OPT23]MRI35414.1 hypothetical protein [Endozoicomonas sp. OPT23]
MSQANNEPFTRWYQEPWAWLIVGILAATFVAGSTWIWYSFKIQDSVVVDDYYKVGKGINIDLTRDRNASELNIAGEMLLDDLTGEIRITLDGDMSEWPQQLKLSLLSPVFKEKDKVVTINRSFSANEQQQVYVGQLDQAISGKTYVQLETLDTLIPEVGYETGWRMNQAILLEPGKTFTLAPGQ